MKDNIENILMYSGVAIVVVLAIALVINTRIYVRNQRKEIEEHHKENMK